MTKNGHPVLQDGTRLQALDAKHTYSELLEWHTRKGPPILHEEILDEAKRKTETGRRPPDEKLPKGVHAGQTEKAKCPFCKRHEVSKSLKPSSTCGWSASTADRDKH